MNKPAQSDPNLVVDYHNSNKRHGWWIIGGIMLISILVTTIGYMTSEKPDPRDKLGVHLLLDDGRNRWDESLWAEHMRYASDVGTYVTQVIRADDLDLERWQGFIDLAASLQLRPILRLATSYDFDAAMWTAPEADADGRYHGIAAQYAEFIHALNYPDSMKKLVIVGNEPNHGEEWGGRPNPAEYARFLVDVGQALKANESQVEVLNGALDWYAPHTGDEPFVNGFYYLDAETFLDGMIAEDPQVFRVIDAWASHAYSMTPPWEQVYQVDYLNGASNPNAEPAPSLLANRGVNLYEWELTKLRLLEVNRVLPIFITETGWSTDIVDAETGAVYLDLALRGNNGRYPDLPETGWIPWLDDGRVVAITPFALNGTPEEWDAHNWLEMSVTGEVLGTRPVYDLMQAFMAKGE